MEPLPVWRSQLPFSDRLTAVVRITSAYRLAHPDATSADASREARALEQEAFNSAASLTDYHERCDSAAAALAPQPAGGQESDSSAVDDFSTAHGIELGKYKHAVHHRNGLFSEVYKAKRPGLDMDKASNDAPQRAVVVALKVTTPSLMTAPHDSEREARILQAAGSEQHRIITLLETFYQAGGRFVLVLEYMPHDLDQLVKQNCLSPKQAKSCLRDLFTALAHLHSLGIIHRDVKPSNILLRSPSGPAFLADFGIAWKGDDKASEPAGGKITDVGTTHYRPPELMFGNTAYNQSLDLWAAGCVIAEVMCLHGESLFDSGELGSELALIQSHFKSLGTPDLEMWPEAAQFPDWGKMQFYEYPAKSWEELLPGGDEAARELVSRLVVYESSRRVSASEALRHRYFGDVGGV